MSSESQLSYEFDTAEPDFRDFNFVDENLLFETTSLSKLGDTNTGVPGVFWGRRCFIWRSKLLNTFKTQCLQDIKFCSLTISHPQSSSSVTIRALLIILLSSTQN